MTCRCSSTWTPIRYVNRAYSRSVLAGLFRSARAALVTPLRDGMAKDYLQVYRSLLRASKRRYQEVPARRPAVLQSEMN